jgi:hypothetical protein
MVLLGNQNTTVISDNYIKILNKRKIMIKYILMITVLFKPKAVLHHCQYGQNAKYGAPFSVKLNSTYLKMSINTMISPVFM